MRATAPFYKIRKKFFISFEIIFILFLTRDLKDNIQQKEKKIESTERSYTEKKETKEVGGKKLKKITIK